MQRRTGTGGTVFVITAGVLRIRGDQRKEPMPVKQRDVVVGTGVGMPSQEMVVIEADFSGRVVVTYVVIVSLW